MSKPSKRTSSRPEASSKAAPRTNKKPVTTSASKSFFRRTAARLVQPVHRLRDLRSRRSHKSFARTRRRDYVRPLRLPGFVAFTGEVIKLLYGNWRIFLLLTIVFTVLALLLGGLSSQQFYTTLSDSFSNDELGISSFIQTGTLVLSSAGILSAGLNETQQVYIGLMVIMTWLVVVWLLREIMAGRSPSLRDGLYSAGSPLVATVLVALLLMVQLVPVGLLALAYSALLPTGLIEQGVGAFLFSAIAALIVTLVLYWVTSSLLAMVIVTLPGMYPWRAMRAASDIIVGRRLQILLRVIWLLLSVVGWWVLVMTPVVLLDSWLTGVADWYSGLPLVSIMVVWLSAAVAVWTATYIYLLYRKVVENDAAKSS